MRDRPILALEPHYDERGELGLRRTTAYLEWLCDQQWASFEDVQELTLRVMREAAARHQDAPPRPLWQLQEVLRWRTMDVDLLGRMLDRLERRHCR